jgi:hypothetical protein
MSDVAKMPKQGLGDKAKKVPSIPVPDFVARMVALFDPIVRGRLFELGKRRQPTQKIIEQRRSAKFITPIPKPKKRKAAQPGFVFDEGLGLSTKAQAYDPTSIINEVRGYVDGWRSLRNPNQWQVTPETARLLEHWRHHTFSDFRPFFCQVEAVEAAIWLTEVAGLSKNGQRVLDHLAAANKDANPELMRLALKLATGAGKTTVMGMKNILIMNDEAHHCYREKPDDGDDGDDLKGDERKEAEKNKEAARVWISGLEAVNRKLKVSRVIDLSATPFFLSGSGYAEGTLFPWTVSDFSLMDAIECGIVKLPRVPVAENIPGTETPMFRNLWENIRKDMPTKGRGKGEELDPLTGLSSTATFNGRPRAVT